MVTPDCCKAWTGSCESQEFWGDSERTLNATEEHSEDPGWGDVPILAFLAPMHLSLAGIPHHPQGSALTPSCCLGNMQRSISCLLSLPSLSGEQVTSRSRFTCKFSLQVETFPAPLRYPRMLSIVRLSGGVSTAEPWMGPGCSGPGVVAISRGWLQRRREGTWMQVVGGVGP